MALLFMDGFDFLTLSDFTATGRWQDSNGGAIGNTSGKLRFTTTTPLNSYISYTNTSSYIEKSIGSNLSAGVLGIAIRLDSSGSSLYRSMPFILYDGTTVQCFVVINSDLTLSICRGTTANILGTTTYTLPTNSWAYLEFKWSISDSISSGDVVLYADGTAILTLAATSDTKATTNAYATKYRINGDSSILNVNITGVYYDDHYFLDLTGTRNNTPLGPVRINSLLPDGNGSNSQMNGSDGNSVNNYLLVNSNNEDGDTSYVESSTVGNKDTYSFANTEGTAGSIYAVAVNLVSKKTDTNARVVNTVTRVSSTDYDNTTTHTLATNYQTYQGIFETNPNTSATWVKSEVDGAEYGVKVNS